MRIIGYDTFLSLLKAAYLLRLVGVPSAHVLVVSPPGTAKTTMAKLFAKAVGAVFVRTTGRYDMLPEDFIAEKEIVYDGGSPKVVWRLRAVERLLRETNQRPGVWLFDEFDKMNRKSMTALLELMEEQQVTLPTGETYPLNFMLIASGNSRKYDRDANPIPRSVRDRFAVYWELGYLGPEEEYQVLEQGIKYLLGEDTSPSEQFKITPDTALFKEMKNAVLREYGTCIVDSVRWLRSHKLVEEPPGPRAYLHAALVISALSTILGEITEDSVVAGFQAAVAGKITVAGDANPFELCEEAVRFNCLQQTAGGQKAAEEEGFFRGKEEAVESGYKGAGGGGVPRGRGKAGGSGGRL